MRPSNLLLHKIIPALDLEIAEIAFSSTSYENDRSYSDASDKDDIDLNVRLVP